MTDRVPTLTKSRAYGVIIQFFGGSDTLQRIEGDLDEELEEAGIESLPPASPDIAQNKKSESYYTADLGVDRWKQMKKQENNKITLPESINELIDRHAPSPRRKGWWLSNAISTFLDSPFESRMQRIATKRQLLTALDGGEVTDPTPVYEMIRDGEEFEEVHERVFTDDREDDADHAEGGVIEDPTAVDWSSVTPDDEVELEAVPDDPSDLSKTRQARAAAAASRIRHSVPSPPTRGAVETYVSEFSRDYQTESTREQIVEETIGRLEQSGIEVDETDDTTGDDEDDEEVDLVEWKRNQYEDQIKEIHRSDDNDLNAYDYMQNGDEYNSLQDMFYRMSDEMIVTMADHMAQEAPDY